MADSLDALDGDCPLAIQFGGIALMALLLAVLQSVALVVLEHTVLGAVVAAAEAAVADNGLCAILAVLEGAADLLRGHAPAQGQCHVQGRVGWDLVFAEGGGGRGEVLASMDYAEIGGRGEVGAQGEERAQGGY